MEYIPVNEPLLEGNEKRYLCECIDTGWISSEGPFVTKFEETMCRTVGRSYGIAVTNGTAALELAVRALGIGSGDEVIMPAFTIISCAEAVLAVGGVPVFVDSDPETWNMKTQDLRLRITERTKAIMVVHLYGLPVDMYPVLALAEEFHLKIIEDAAEMHGQTYDGKPCGSFGDISTFSFYPNKHVTTGEGGMILTDDEALAEKCRLFRNLCFRKDARYVHEELSGNYRFTNLQAAIGLAQLERLEEFVSLKRRMGAYYTERFKGIPGIRLPKERTEYADNIYWVYGVVLTEEVRVTNKEMVSRLAEEGIGSRTFFWCMHEQPVLRNKGGYRNESYKNAEYLARKGFYIPSGLKLKEEQMERAADVLIKILRHI